MDPEFSLTGRRDLRNNAWICTSQFLTLPKQQIQLFVVLPFRVDRPNRSPLYVLNGLQQRLMHTQKPFHEKFNLR